MNRRQRRAAEAVARARDPNSLPDEYTQRLQMLVHNELAIQMLLGRCFAAGGDPDIAVLVVDFRDAVGRHIAAVVDPEGHAARIAGENQIPTALLVVPRSQAARGFEIGHPRTSEALRRSTPPGLVPVAVIGFGGVTLLGLPFAELTAAALA